MMFGITGSHRSGKTTLARRIEAELGVEFHETSTTQVAKELGYDPVAPMTLDQRVALQVGLFQRHLETISNGPRPMIVDRTPADYLGYLLAEFDMQSHLRASPAAIRLTETMRQTAISSLASRYDTIFYVSPLPIYEVDPAKPAPNVAFQQHHSLLVQGILSEAGAGQRFNCVWIREHDLELRVDTCCQFIVERLDAIETMRKSASHVH